MRILMLDVGGTHVKLMASGQEGVRHIPSGPKLTAGQTARAALRATKDWEYDAVTIGYPGLVVDGKPAREPHNLGNGWMRYDFAKVFGAPVRFINDASMQALASYREGRMLFLGFGTSIGASLVVDNVIVSLELGTLYLPEGKRLIDLLTDEARKKRGLKRWLRSAHDAIEMLRGAFFPDDIVLGGGNSPNIVPLPAGCRQRDNHKAFLGATRLWGGADLLVEPSGTSWRIIRRDPTR